MSLAPGAQLGPYAIRSQLGQGGMGVVYLAQDPRLDRQVAIKVLTRDTTAKQRFLQEAKAASALDHPNICTIHEINETADGQLYLVMAHYQGETLKERIGRGPLALDDAIDIATQVGQGLAEAHVAGIVHRDIKPANLLITKSGTVKILDFGLAKLVGVDSVTQAGTVGTVAYMSPAQARGEEVDHGTDIWSLGVVLYEMLSGQLPFQGDNLLAISKAILEHPTPMLTGEGAALNGVVGRALSKSESARHQAVTELLGELRSTSGAETPTTAHPELPSIAVLPFRNMSTDPEQEYFCEGLAEELIDALARLDGLRVAARTSAFQFGGKGHDLSEIGKKLNVRTVLEGSVRKSSNRLRVNAQLINIDDGYHLWSERYDRDMDDVFAVQDEIARAVVDKLKGELLGPQHMAAVRRPTESLEAYNLFLKGRHHFARYTRGAHEKARVCFARALTVEPRYAHAHAGVALVQARQALLSFAEPRVTMPRAKAAALQALAIDETVAYGHVALAVVLHLYEWDWPGAAREYRRALELNPGETVARSVYAQLLMLQGHADAAMAETRDAAGHDPLSAYSRRRLSNLLWVAGQYDASIAEASAGLELEPGYHPFLWDLGCALMGLGRPDEAVRAFRQATVVAPDDPSSLGFLGWMLGVAGERQEAGAILETLKRRRTEEYFSGWVMAHVCLGLGDHGQAVAWLERAAEERDSMLPLSYFPSLDPLRADPRFQALLRRLNFPETAANG